jgi:glycerol-3-phosphate acyltransferase PlsX
LTEGLTIALDAMGGDKAPESVVEGAAIALEHFPDIRYLMFGDAQRVESLAARYHVLKPCCEFVHTDVAVAMHEKPAIALRQGKNSSMRMAIEAVEHKRAAAVVSSGNTGALMAMSKIVLRTLPGINRPAIIGMFPTLTQSTSMMLDVGADVAADSNDLVQFAIMGEAYARAVFGIESPSIGLLNIGSEDMKGHDEVKAAHLILRSSGLPLNYKGFVEGNDITAGTVDVIVTDGFTGNVALKAIEGTARLFSGGFKRSFSENLWSKASYVVARPVINRFKNTLDPRRFNGAMFIGLNGISVKSHGSADGFAFSQAVGVAVSLAQNKINTRITEEIKLSGLSAPLTANGNGVH